MSQSFDSKENTRVHVLMNKMNIGSGDGQAQGHSKQRLQDKVRKQKQGTGASRSTKSLKSDGTSLPSDTNIPCKSDGASGRPLSSKSRHNGNRKASSSQQNVFKANNPNSQTHNEYKIIINNTDMDICRQTASNLFQIRESIRPDPALQAHLAMLQFNITHFMLDQQRKMLYHQEQVRQLEIAKWLSTKSEEEQREYLDRQQCSFR
jgi:hypothetical protein